MGCIAASIRAALRTQFIQEEWSKRVHEIKKKYDSAIKKSRPYYTALGDERKLGDQAQAAAQRFERATSILAVAKQQVKLTQDALTRQKVIEPECLEVDEFFFSFGDYQPNFFRCSITTCSVLWKRRRRDWRSILRSKALWRTIFWARLVLHSGESQHLINYTLLGGLESVLMTRFMREIETSTKQ